ncbi:DegQ family serine endoprotease [Alishewanella sp. BS5-314]|uniref:DegQ family serine endoprotease n=1 Tax=Alishewanella sp. BS5-314 TaxID=2755587 RepID=UPI0021BB99EA|nr:DegQ family serine endoprotease [Alishewanella sp. BS5-314]MCT8127176.1 DegQ family serine endoprotease [Alishewanella sp. BS5-314]
MNKKLSLLSAAVFAAFTLTAVTPANAALPFLNRANQQEMPTLAPMLEQATPAVVYISVAGSREVRQRVPDAFRHFFGPRGPGEMREERPFRGLGSGVIIDAAKGYIVTNNHVVQDASEIQVRLKDGRTFSAKKLGADPESDIALLQIEAKDLVQLPLADSDQLRVGDFAIAIGNPFGLEQTVTSGIISSLSRSGLNRGDAFEDFIQTDAAINSGNSGGALVNLRGELIGINTAILGPNGGNIGIGFAIPSNMMKNLVDQILEFGEVRRGSLGVRGSNVTAELTKALNLNVNRGAFVGEVLPDSAAAKAGLQSGDVIVSINSNRIQSFDELRAKIATLGAGREVTLGVLRDGRERNIKVTLQEAASTTVEATELHPMLRGATLSNTERGIEITAIEANSAAAQVGLRQGDLIIGVNRQRVSNMNELRRLLEQRDGGVAALNIQRGDSLLYILIR